MTDEVVETQPGASGWSWKKWLVVGCLGVLGVLLLYYAVTLLQVMRAGRQRSGSGRGDRRARGRPVRRPPSPQLAARLDHALELYDEGVAPVVMVTGGNQPGDRFTEADGVGRLPRRPWRAGVGDHARSRRSHHLRVALRRRRSLLAAGLDDVLIVTDPYHSLRSRLIAEEVGLDAPCRRRRPAS